MGSFPETTIDPNFESDPKPDYCIPEIESLNDVTASKLYLMFRQKKRIVDKGRRPKSTIKVNRAPINDTGARVIKTITSCEIAIQMMPILGIQTSLLHLVFYSIFEHFVIFLLCIIKCVNHEKRLQI